MPKYRLNEKHLFFQKFEELCAKAEELRIKIDYGCYPVVIDTNSGASYDLEDIESEDSVMSEFPPQTEYKLTFKK